MNTKEKIVREEFGSICEAYNLLIDMIGDGEIALIGITFLLLVWLDREGVSVKYVRLTSSKFEIIDIGKFIAQKRGWVVCGSPGADEDTEARLRRECSSFALNLQKSAADILQGGTDWLKEISESPSALSDHTKKAIQSALERSRKSREVE
jgi:hypothetical protein